MISIPYIKLCFDRKFRKNKFANIMYNGLKVQILSSLSYVKYHIEHQNKEMEFDINSWKDLNETINEKYKLLNSYGYKGREEYLDTCFEEDPELELLDIISDINRLAITNEDEANHVNTINEYNTEIEASENILKMLEKMASVVSSHKISSLEEIDSLFKKHDCYLLLNMPSIIDYEKIFEEHYCA